MTKRAHGKGLRRVNPATLSYSTKCDEKDCWGRQSQTLEGLCDVNGIEGQTIARIFKMPLTQNGTAPMDEHLHHLVGICTTVHSQVRAVTQKIGRTVEAVNATDGDSSRKACELLRIYERTIWPSIVQVDLNIKSLSNFVRESIDSCKINDPRLEWLLNISKFRVTMEKVIDSAIGICAEIDRVLRIRARGEVRGLRIKQHTVAEATAIQRELATNIVKKLGKR